MSSPSAGWHDVEHAPPRSASKPPVSPAKTAPPRQSRRLAGLPTENIRLEPTINYVNSLCDNQEERRWENLYAHFVTTSAPPTSYHEEFAHAGKAQANKDPDTYSWEQAMASPYQEQFLEAANLEVKELTEHNTWFKDSMGNATTKIVPSQCVFASNVQQTEKSRSSRHNLYCTVTCRNTKEKPLVLQQHGPR